MKAPKGILALSYLKNRNHISDETVNIVTAFHENDESTGRLCQVLETLSALYKMYINKNSFYFVLFTFNLVWFLQKTTSR